MGMQNTIHGLIEKCGEIEFHHLEVQCRVVDYNAAFGHDLLKTVIRDAVADIDTG